MDKSNFESTVNPEISVIVPAHNEEKTILSCIEALAGQKDCPEYEIVVACNGCVDSTAQVVRSMGDPRIRVFETERSGMSFGKNFGAENASGELLVFVDADTVLPPEGLKVICSEISGKSKIIGTMAGWPERGGAVVKVCFLIANMVTRKNRVHAPGGVMVMQREVFAAVGGFDEKLPQGTSSDFIMRAREAGAEYVFVSRVKAVTSIRRFEKTGIISQMLAWRKNHQDMEAGRHREVESRKYEDIR